MPEPIDEQSGQQRSRALLRSVLGDALRRTRGEQARTLADVAAAANISMPYLSEVERGRKEASSEVLAAVCAALGIEITELLWIVLRDLTGELPTARVMSLPTARPATPSRSGPASSAYVLAA